MALMPIRKYGDPVLRAKAARVESFDRELRTLVDDMVETMQAASGIGLAAPQVGISKALCVVDIGLIQEGAAPKAYINPEVLEESGDEEPMEEGCLSIPGVVDDVMRRKRIRLRFQNLRGETQEEICDDLHARVLLHEIDHLHGIFFTDRLGSLKRKLLAKKLREIAAEAQREMRERDV